MTENLSAAELKALVQSVFSLSHQDKKLAILVDLPDETVPDNDDWRIRRTLAQQWWHELNHIKQKLPLEEINLIIYPNVHSNNADLPQTAYLYQQDWCNIEAADKLKMENQTPFSEIFTTHQLFIALTEFSATAPLKLTAKQFGFRAVTMPGFSPLMIPALRLDYEQINDRIMKIKSILDPAIALDIDFRLPGSKIHHVHFDLRFRTAHASGGRFPQAGTAGNLPGGECYIVPYEGEEGAVSLSNGTLPVQFEDEIVLYKITTNVATQVLSNGRFSEIERKKLVQEPAYGNIAEIGFGILRDFGIAPIGEILLDEKLGLHIAFGRSDHFGGAVGIKNFSKPEHVIHIDRIYIPETQPDIHVNHVTAVDEQGKETAIIRDGEYEIF